MVSSKTLKLINTYYVVPINKTLGITPTKVLKKKRKMQRQSNLATIKQAQSDTTASSRFPLTAPCSVSQAIIHSHTNKIALYNKSNTAYCADSRASEDMFPDYSVFNTYHRLSNRYAILGDTIRLPIDGIGTAVYTLNGCTILTCNALHVTVLCGPIYSLCQHHQIPGCGVYSSYKYGSYLFFPDFILQL